MGMNDPLVMIEIEPQSKTYRGLLGQRTRPAVVQCNGLNITH